MSKKKSNTKKPGASKGRGRVTKRAGKDAQTTMAEKNEMLEDAPTDVYQPITWERAKEIGELLVDQDDDDQCAMFLELLHAIAYAHFHPDDTSSPTFEGLVHEAASSAYTQTKHFLASADRFALANRGRTREQKL